MTRMKLLAVVLGMGLTLIAMGAALPAGSDRDLIVRLQGEITVLQRQIRDLQETIDRNHATSSQTVTRMAENSENSAKTIASLADRLNQGDSLQHNSLSGVVKRLTQVEESVGQSNGQLAEINRSLREIKASLQRSAPPKPEN